MESGTLHKNYKEHLSGYRQWDQLDHAEDWMLFPGNMGEHLCIDEVAISQGELYTVVTNAEAKTQQGSLIAMIKSTNSDEIEQVLKQIPEEQRASVKTFTTDLAESMQQAGSTCFFNAELINDRFHVQQLVTEAVQQERLKHRRAAIKEENKAIKQARENGTTYESERFSNGDTRKELLARSRYLLFKASSKWTASQKQRAAILFNEYPDIEEAYNLSMHFRGIYEHAIDRNDAISRLSNWYKKVEEKGFDSFETAAETVSIHENAIVQYFVSRRTNALAEAFNSKIKAFRSIFRGVRDLPFFLFRVGKIFA